MFIKILMNFSIPRSVPRFFFLLPSPERKLVYVVRIKRSAERIYTHTHTYTHIHTRDGDIPCGILLDGNDEGVPTLFLYFRETCDWNMPPSSALRTLYRVIARFVTRVSTLGGWAEQDCQNILTPTVPIQNSSDYRKREREREIRVRHMRLISF